MTRKGYSSDVSDEEWAFIAALSDIDERRLLAAGTLAARSLQRLAIIVRSEGQWRMMPNDLPPWHTVYQQTRRWQRADVFETVVHDLRMLLREIADRDPQPSTAVMTECKQIA